MTTHLHDDVLAALDAVEILSPTRYAVLGVTREFLQGPATGPSPWDAEPDRFATTLAGDLYQHLYICPSPLRAHPRTELLTSRDLIAALSQANTGTGTWERGWVVRRIEGDGCVVVSRDGVNYWADASQVRPRGGSVRERESCRVRMPKELRELIWGFYMAIGDGDGQDESGDDEAERPALDRYYWHLSLAAAVPFLAAATSRLNAARIPFRLKVVNEPQAYRRADSGVLYVHRRDRRQVGAVVADLHRSIARSLGEEVPLFTRRLAPGLGFAEDPGGELSFGQHRCLLIARALWRSFLRGDRDREARARRWLRPSSRKASIRPGPISAPVPGTPTTGDRCPLTPRVSGWIRSLRRAAARQPPRLPNCCRRPRHASARRCASRPTGTARGGRATGWAGRIWNSPPGTARSIRLPRRWDRIGMTGLRGSPPSYSSSPSGPATPDSGARREERSPTPYGNAVAPGPSEGPPRSPSSAGISAWRTRHGCSTIAAMAASSGRKSTRSSPRWPDRWRSPISSN